MVDDIIKFGDKKEFAIEIKPNKLPKKFYLKLWFNNLAIGDFKKAGSLDYLVTDYFKFLKNINFITDDEFECMSEEEIFNDIVFDIATERTQEEEDKLVDRMNRFSWDVGDFQFNQFTFLLINLKKEDRLTVLVYEMDGVNKPKLHVFSVRKDYFFKVYKEVICFIFDHNLKRNKPFFPLGFSVNDLQQ